jgi:hypothetical protein
MRPIKYTIEAMELNESRVFTGTHDSARTAIRIRQRKLNKLFNVRPYEEGKIIVLRTK